ncbi:Clp protease N-terminal domain-containing protein [Nonomuraea sp. LPB2021202275-12-8]|uniref:Clp protease N-terminal domain-containing protein n=1 Tax=Nonomuraea sp. LPB2021202275-12-8 TaxID=3120159 RepID=UPI00300D7020
MATIDHYINAIIEQAGCEAQETGSATIEAHHLLLAIAVKGETGTRQVLTSAGLDHQAIRDALDREFEHSLSAAGVSLAAFDLPRPSRAAKPSTQLGASAKLALERGFASADRKRDLRPAHLLLGVLRAQAGTVPRALTLAGVDQAELAARVMRSLTLEGG